MNSRLTSGVLAAACVAASSAAHALTLTAGAGQTNATDGSNDPNLASLGLDNSNGEMRGHWDYPAELGAVWHF